MRGCYQREIREEPGTCGGCVHFERGNLGPYLSAQGRCKIKPEHWTYSQAKKACKSLYKAKEDGDPHCLECPCNREIDFCPHCGGTARVIEEPGEPNGGFRVCCDSCFAQTGLSITQDEAIGRWNKRAGK